MSRPPLGNLARLVPVTAALLGLTLLSGCATYSEGAYAVRTHAGASQPELALGVLERHRGGSEDRVVYLLNRGMLLRMQGDYQASNEALEQAKGLIEALRAVSVSEQAAALALNESRRSYLGDPHEQLLLHVYKALNHLGLGDDHGARVEVLQADLLLQQLDAEQRRRSGEALLRYLAGSVFEQAGEWSDAMIAYRKAYQAYLAYPDGYGIAVPPFLQQDLLRLSARLGLDDEHRDYVERFGPGRQLPEQGTGTLLVVLSDGLVPTKLEQSVQAWDGRTGRLYRIATPYYPPAGARPAPILRLEIDDRRIPGALAENVEALARDALAAQLPVLTARALGRAVVKAQATRNASDKDPALGLLVNVVSFASERADTRSWITLPAQVHLARVDLPPGRYELRLALADRFGAVRGEQRYSDVVIEPGRITYLSEHWPGTRRLP